MKKTFMIVFALLLSAMMTANAQNLKTILKKHFEAVGQSKINAAEAVVINGKISQMGMELPFTIYQKKPGKVKFEASFQDMKIIQSFDGVKGWSINPMVGTEPTDMGPAEIKGMKTMSDMEGRLYNWKKKKNTVTYIGDETENGETLYKLKLVTSDGAEETYYINSLTYFVSKVDSKDKVQGMDVEATKIYSDYRDVEGYKIPFKTETIMMGQSAGDMEITSFEFKKASEVADSMFDKP